MTKAIIFDCFGVLTADTWREFVRSLPIAQQAEASHLNHLYGSAELDKQTFLHHIQELTGRQPIDIDLLLDSETSKNYYLLNYIATLKAEYKIGMLSNIATNWIRDEFLTVEEQALFDDMVLSYEVGTTKPDPKIFEIAAERLGVEPNECVFIDDIESYAAAAETVGMHGITYKDFKQMKTELEAALAADAKG